MKYLIYCTIALSPMPYASVRPVWQTLWVILIGLIAAYYPLQSAKQPLLQQGKTIILPITLVLLFVAWSFCQALLPFGHFPQFGIALVDDILTSSGLISVRPSTTITNSIFYLSHAVFTICVFGFCLCISRAIRLIRFCGIVTTLYMIYGFAVYYLNPEFNPAYPLTSTFVNRNNFAAYAGLGLQCLLAYYFFLHGTLQREKLRGRQRLHHFVDIILTKNWWLFLSFFILFSGLLLTHSRAGFTSISIAVFLLFIICIMPMNATKLKTSYTLIALLLFSFIGSTFALSGEILETRLLSDFNLNTRLNLYSLIAQAIPEQALVGTGLGTFEKIFSLYRDETVTKHFVRGHNDFLELGLTAGLPSATLLITACLLPSVYLIKPLIQSNQYRSLLALGVTTSLQLALHSLVDFPLQIPAISYLWCAIVSACLALSVHLKETQKSLPR